MDIIKNELLSVREASKALGVSEQFTRKYINNGDLKSYRIGERLIRIRRSDLEDFFKRITK